MDQDRCLGMIVEEAGMNRRELGVISRGLDLCESTLCSDVAGLRGIQACRQWPAQSAVMVSTGWPVEHLISLHCLQVQVHMHVRESCSLSIKDDGGRGNEADDCCGEGCRRGRQRDG